jgi:hypothetical protein
MRTGRGEFTAAPCALAGARDRIYAPADPEQTIPGDADSTSVAA